MHSYFIHQQKLINKQFQISRAESSYSENLCIMKVIGRPLQRNHAFCISKVSKNFF